ncbi:Uma2 family endonuclease [Crocosphaera sp. UHCC 0190]|uniref:Uma2 family endonuclease n=1 Tax=Crocosphaera sp. UHCC 0190 TaxID=3110246 RepID=UPI002B1E92EB|nr:Uma2 family endonuclease [Crocosphaera sp. UHCC 0190]MEA5509551.1 Uma2 family endonuclease [Crocosphaera sp. UHCC 0190]
MIANSDNLNLTPDEYLSFEEKSDIKHEYRQGEIYAMAGASNNHVLITVNMATLLRNHLRGKGCLTYISDTKVRIDPLNTYYYPDITVSCDERDRNLTQYICYPCLIIEVLSDSTEAFDRGDKFADYRQLQSLQEYVLISQKTKRIDTFLINEQGQWMLSSHDENDPLILKTINFSCLVSEIYEDITFQSVS